MKRIGLLPAVTLLIVILLANTIYALPHFTYKEDNGESNRGIYTVDEISGSVRSFTPFAKEISGQAVVFAWQSDMIADTFISKREEGLDMKGVIPELTEVFDTDRDTINEEIAKTVATKIAAAKESKARSIDFDYSIYDEEELVSIILLSTVTSASSKTEVASINFNPDTGEVIRLSEVFDSDLVSLAEKMLAEKIRRDPERFTSVLETLPPEQPYYLTDSQVVLLFDEFYLVPHAEGVTKLDIDLDSIESVTISSDDYYQTPGYNVKMVPLRQVCAGLGYDVQWMEDRQVIEIYQDSTLIMELKPGVNNYLVRDKKQRSLEAAPELKNDDDCVYVPISFFDQILSLIAYSVDEREDITFLSYMGDV